MKFVVIGAGVIGSTLHRLLKRAGHDVIVVEAGKRKVYPTLIHSLLLKGEDVWLARRTLELYDQLRVKTREFPAYTILRDKGELPHLWEEVGVKIEEKYIDWLSSEAIVTRGSDRLVWIGSFIKSTPVVKGEARLSVNGGKTRVTVEGVQLSADYVILAAGAWNSKLYPEVRSKSYFCWAVAAYGPRQLDSSFVYDYELGFYSRPLLGLGLPLGILGDGDVVECEPEERLRVDYRNLVREASKRLGKLTPLYVGWGHCEGSPDMRPAYGRLRDDLLYVGGLDGYGAEVGPAVAEMVVDLVLKGEEKAGYLVDRFDDVQDFRLGREPHELP